MSICKNKTVGKPLMWLRNEKMIETGNYHTIKLMSCKDGYSIVAMAEKRDNYIRRYNNLDDALEDYGIIWDCLRAGANPADILV